MRTWMILIPLLTFGCSGDSKDSSDTGLVGDDDDDTSDDDDDDDVTGDVTEIILALTGDAAAGGPLYTTNCEGCHLVDGAGQTGPNIQGASLEEVVSTVYNGDGIMAAYGVDGTLTDQEIADIAAYVTTTFL